MTDGPLLSVRGLTVSFPDRPVPVLDGVDFRIDPGERVGIVGPSGAGKTLTLLTLTGLQPPAARVRGEVRWKDEDLLGADPSRLRRLRGRAIGTVFQAPATALHPLQRVDRQVAEALEVHRVGSGTASVRGELRVEARRLLERVGVGPAGGGRWPWPHELSGGQRQRVVIAMAVANRPRLLLADEPTTALDTTVQARVLRLLESLRRESGAALLLVSHDLDLVAEVAERVLVLDDGRIVEEGPAAEVLRHRARSLSATPSPPPSPPLPPSDPLLRVESLRVHYRRSGLWREAPPVRAVDGVDLELHAGETLAVVGESGSGKSTLARTLLGLQIPVGGRVLLDGTDVARAGGRELRDIRRRIQIVFQDPGASLNPRRRMGAQVAQPMRDLRGLTRTEALAEAARLLERVALPAEYAHRLPGRLSTGEQQRVAIARALGPGPEVLVLDEPVSALDRPVRDGILELLARLQAEEGLAYVLVSHDLGVVRDVAHRVAVMQEGRIVESRPAAELFARPRHAHTRELLASIPRGDGALLTG